MLCIYIRSSWWWAQYGSKHVEEYERNIINKRKCIKLELKSNITKMHGQQHIKILYISSSFFFFLSVIYISFTCTCPLALFSFFYPNSVCSYISFFCASSVSRFFFYVLYFYLLFINPLFIPVIYLRLFFISLFSISLSRSVIFFSQSVLTSPLSVPLLYLGSFLSPLFLSVLY